MADGPPVPDDLKEKGWRTRQSRGHPGHFYYYNAITKESFWKLSQAYAAVEFQRRKEEKIKVKADSCDRSTLRQLSVQLVVLGLIVAYFMSYVSYWDGLTFFNSAVMIIAAWVVIVHTLMAPWFLDNLYVLYVYVPWSFLIWAFETVLFVFSYLINKGDKTTRAELAEMEAAAGGGFSRHVAFTPSMDGAMDRCGKLIVALFLFLNLFQFMAYWFGSNRLAQLAQVAAEQEKENNSEKKTLIKRSKKDKGDGAAAQQHQEGEKDQQSDRLMNMYDSLFRQYGIDPPEHILDNESISSSDTLNTTTQGGSVGSRKHSRKSRR